MAPIPYVSDTPLIVDVTRSDPTRHDVVEFRIVQIAGHHFKGTHARLPVKLLTLEATEELVISKAKKRPVVVLASTCIEDVGTLSAVDGRRAKDVSKRCFFVAPMYTPATPENPGAFMPTLVARVRALRYPHLACLPRLGENKVEPGEIVRLDRLYVTPMLRGCDRTKWKLSDEVLKLLVDQLLWTTSGSASDYLREVSLVVADALPDALKGD